MKTIINNTCRTCSTRNICTTLCNDIRKLLPSDNKGKLRNEISLSNSEGFEDKLGVSTKSVFSTHCNEHSMFDIKKLFGLLTREQFAVFRLKLEGAGWWDVSNELNITEQTAKERLKRAIRKIRKHISYIVIGD